MAIPGSSVQEPEIWLWQGGPERPPDLISLSCTINQIIDMFGLGRRGRAHPGPQSMPAEMVATGRVTTATGGGNNKGANTH